MTKKNVTGENPGIYYAENFEKFDIKIKSLTS